MNGFNLNNPNPFETDLTISAKGKYHWKLWPIRVYINHDPNVDTHNLMKLCDKSRSVQFKSFTV